MSNPVTDRYYFAAKLKLQTPLSISSGEGLNTDADVLRDGENRPYIPGTSAAGAIRNYLRQKKDKPGIMGYADSDDGRMSSLFISDLHLEGTVSVTKRDGIRLDENKIVEATGKFDREIVEPDGVSAVLYVEAVKREGDDADFISEIEDIVQAIDDGDIRFGSKKNRGFGWMEVEDLYERHFSRKNAQEWPDFASDWKKKILRSEWKAGKRKRREDRERFITFRVPLRQEGSISIRTYSAKPGEPDFSHITSGDVPVIPGSSFNGAIRSRAREILMELECPPKYTAALINDLFGSANQSGKQACHQSRIVYRECKIQNAVRLQTTRNKIDRFSMATVGGALYTEISYACGQTELVVKLEKFEQMEGAAGLLMLLFDELETGYLSVGGEAGIGHGIFTADEESDPCYGSGLDRETCMKALYQLVSKQEA